MKTSLSSVSNGISAYIITWPVYFPMVELDFKTLRVSWKHTDRYAMTHDSLVMDHDSCYVHAGFSRSDENLLLGKKYFDAMKLFWVRTEKCSRFGSNNFCDFEPADNFEIQIWEIRWHKNRIDFGSPWSVLKDLGQNRWFTVRFGGIRSKSVAPGPFDRF